MRIKQIENKKLKGLVYASLRMLLDLSVTVLRRLGLKSVYCLADYLGDVFYLFTPSYRQRVLHHVRLAFTSDKTEAEIRGIARMATRNFIRNFLELFPLLESLPDGIGRRIVLEGKEYLDETLAQGNGVITLSAHFGNFIIIGPRFAHEGYAFNMIIKDPTEEWYPGWGQTLRDQMGFKTIPLRPRNLCAQKILKALKNNEIVCMIADDNKPSGGVFVDFFGKKAATPKGPAALSLKTGAPILPMFIIRQPLNTHKIIIEPPLKIDLSGNSDIDVLKITQAFTQVIEAYVRKYPDHWNWSRRRWKTQPMQLGEMDNKCVYGTDRGI